MDEKWLTVPGYEARYEVSNLFRVRRIADGKILADDNGRVRLLRADGKHDGIRTMHLAKSLFPEIEERELNLPGEIWKEVPDSNGLYEISNKLRVRSIGREFRDTGKFVRSIRTRVLKLSKNNGYIVAGLFIEGRQRKLYVEATAEHLFPEIVAPLEDGLSQPGEKWLPIKGYDGLYKISNFGRVKSVGWYVNGQRRRYNRPKIMVGGYILDYPKIDLAKMGKSKTLLIHRLVAEAFVPNPLELPIVHHKDEDKGNPRFDNLEWTTRGGNVQDWFDRRRLVVNADTIEAILAAGASGKSPAEILAALPRQRKARK